MFDFTAPAETIAAIARADAERFNAAVRDLAAAADLVAKAIAARQADLVPASFPFNPA